jgi:hypothetical protein
MNNILHVSTTPTSYNFPSPYQSQSVATEHSSTCKFHSHKLQKAKYKLSKEERYCVLF